MRSVTVPFIMVSVPITTCRTIMTEAGRVQRLGAAGIRWCRKGQNIVQDEYDMSLSPETECFGA